MPNLIGITGGSGSGKSYLAKGLANYLGQENTTLIQLDNYYVEQTNLTADEKALYNWDLPCAINFAALETDVKLASQGTAVNQRAYDFEIHKPIVFSEKIQVKQFVIIEGIFALYSPEVRKCLDLRIFVNAPTSLRYARRLARDQKERGRTEAEIRRQFDEQVEPAYIEFVAPQMAYADSVVSSTDEESYNFEKLLQPIS
ncbi:hypothetical protein MLD52_18485 [Puniceicoccaceae bacterium K14]|nr:hypothetical protein [Puniceicoccaceae bacterium K14]